MPVAVARKRVIVDATRFDQDFVGGVADKELPVSGAVVGPGCLDGVVERLQLDAVAAGRPHRQRRGDPPSRRSAKYGRQHLLELRSELAPRETVEQEVDGVVDVHQQKADDPGEAQGRLGLTI